MTFKNEKGIFQGPHGDWVCLGPELVLRDFHCLGGKPRTLQFQGQGEDNFEIGGIWAERSLPITITLKAIKSVFLSVPPAILDAGDAWLLEPWSLE